MKFSKIILTALLVTATFTLVTYTACKKDLCDSVSCLNGGACNDGKCVCPDGYTGTLCETKIDPCDSIVCLNGGTCIDGSCACANGYEGARCETETREKFIGLWTGSDVCNSGTYTIDMTLQSSTTGATVVLIKNPGGFGQQVSIIGNISDKEINILSQDVGSTRKLTGRITHSNSQLIFEYTVTDDSGNSESCVGTYTRK